MTTRDAPAEDRTRGPSGEEEAQRLIRVAAQQALPMRRLLEAAGISAGMNVLEIGSGPGDVAFLAAEFVGPAGSVTGVEIEPAFVETANRRARDSGAANVSFVVGDLRDLHLDGIFDAVIGRNILIHLGGSVAAFRALVDRLRPGGVAAFLEPEHTLGLEAIPPSPLLEQFKRWLLAWLLSKGAELSMGTKLYHLFIDSGLEPPEMAAHCSVDPGTDPDVPRLYAATIRGLLPQLVERGIATEEEVGIETLADRLAAELSAERRILISPPFVQAWARKP
jgi:ubiquinone/menaquinone biosynthesis C-methylase UbiE